jgi:hypothetical protein
VSEFQPLIDLLYREEVLRARALGEAGRMQLAMEITEENLEAAKLLGEDEMLRRYRIVRTVEEHGCYGPPFPRL